MDGDEELRGRLAAMEGRLVARPAPELRRATRGRLVLSFGAAPLLVLGLAATATAGAIIVAGAAQGHPGVENPGQPLYGERLECLTPPEAARVIAAHGITKVVWQVERGVAGQKGGTSTQQPTPPETGRVNPGAIVDGTLYIVVDQRQGATASGVCDGR